MNQQEFKEITNEVAVEIDVNPNFTSYKTISAARTKKAAEILNNLGRKATVNIFNKKYLIVRNLK